MIKCFFADVKSISSEIARTEFDESKIEDLAEIILATDGLVRPLILKQTGLEQYTVIEGNLEYYAAVRAKEKDPRRAEMVNAFVIPDRHQQFAIAQLNLLSETKSTTISSSTNVRLSIEQLTSVIAEQLQPLQQQMSTVVSELAEHKKILESFGSGRIKSVDLQPKKVNVDLDTLVTTEQMIDRQVDIIPINQPIAKSIQLEPEQLIPVEAKSTIAKTSGDKSKSTKTQVKAKAAKADKIAVIDRPLEPTTAELTTPATKATTPKKTKSRPKSKIELDPAIDPIKAANTLNLINTLSESDLLLRMQKSGLPAGAVKLVSTIIDQRNTQPEQKFDSWEVAMSEVAGLKSATAANMIDKLK